MTPEEKQFVLDADVARRSTWPALAAQVEPARRRRPQVYAASLLAIDTDTDAERQLPRRARRGARLDAATVAQLHQMTGAPQA